MKKAVLIALLALCGPSCGPHDNLQACKDTLTKFSKCGTFDPTTRIDCTLYSSYTCDMGAYWDCLAQNFKCSADSPVTTGWNTCLAGCN
jgi:hypothetical protein